MSGAFESVAGAFAAVGVADVLVRTCGEVIGFLRDVADAPEDISRLHKAIEETVILAQGAIQCLNNLKARRATTTTTGGVAALESSTKALNREVQALRLLIGKFKGNKTWSRVKYVLSETKVTKAIRNLEHSKSQLASAVALAGSELSALGHATIEKSMRTGFDQLGIQIDASTNTVVAKLDSQQQAIITTLAANQRKHVTQNTQDHEILLTKLDGFHTQQLACHDAGTQAISSVQSTLSDVLGRQRMATHLSEHTHKQTTTVLRTLERTDMRVAKASRTQIGMLSDVATDVKTLLSLSNDGAVQVQQSNRTISFLGERQDKILTWLLPHQDDLISAIDQLVSQHGQEVSIPHVYWLRSEIGDLVDSAMVERTAQIRRSGARSIDQWLYPEDTVEYLRDRKQKRTVNGPFESTRLAQNEEEEERAISRLHKVRKYRNKTWTITTPSGRIDIALPSSSPTKTPARHMEEVSFSSAFEQGQTRVAIHARFLRDMASARCLRQYTQLNVFTTVDNEFNHACFTLFTIGTIEDVDLALREGIISPFHLEEGGMNTCLYNAAYYGRMDILDYLESQGVGQSALNHDSTILFILSWLPSRLRGLDGMALDRLADRAADPTAFVSRLAVSLIMKIIMDRDDWAVDPLIKCLNILRDFGYNVPALESLHQVSLDREYASDLIRFLFTAEVSSNDTLYWGMSYISFCLYIWHPENDPDEDQVIKVIALLIELGVDVSRRDIDGLTASAYARCLYLWPQWCKALESNNQNIERVLELEGNSWLLQEDWREVWTEKGYTTYWFLRGIFSEGIESEVDEDSDEEEEMEDSNDEEETDDRDDEETIEINHDNNDAKDDTSIDTAETEAHPSDIA